MAHEPAKIHPSLTLQKISEIVKSNYVFPIDSRRMSQKIVAAQYKKQQTDYRKEFYLLS